MLVGFSPFLTRNVVDETEEPLVQFFMVGIEIEPGGVSGDIRPPLIHSFGIEEGKCTLSGKGGKYCFSIAETRNNEPENTQNSPVSVILEMEIGSNAMMFTFDARKPLHPGHLKFSLWMAMAFAGIPKQTAALHASVIVYNNRAILFLGESGTGKSTHAALWLKHIPGCSLLNDDSPLIRIELDENKQLVPFVYGSPWSGKGQCYLNERYPVAAFVRLQQHKINQVTRLSKLGAFIIANITALKIIEEYINAGISVRLTVRGNIMSPLLLDGIDSVMLHPCIATELKPQEIILFRYKGGFMLHRIIRIELIAGQYQVSSITTKGDAQNNTETITPEDVVAVASLPKQTFIRKLYRRMVFTGIRVKIKLARMRLKTF